MFNIARAFFDKKQYAKAMEYLQKALQLNPDHEESRRFAAFLTEKGLAKTGPMPEPAAEAAPPAAPPATEPSS